MNHRKVLKELGGEQFVASRIGQKYNTVMKWKYRNSIPPDQWPALINLAQDIDCHISYKMLSEGRVNGGQDD